MRELVMEGSMSIREDSKPYDSFYPYTEDERIQMTKSYASFCKANNIKARPDIFIDLVIDVRGLDTDDLLECDDITWYLGNEKHEIRLPGWNDNWKFVHGYWRHMYIPSKLLIPEKRNKFFTLRIPAIDVHHATRNHHIQIYDDIMLTLELDPVTTSRLRVTEFDTELNKLIESRKKHD